MENNINIIMKKLYNDIEEIKKYTIENNKKTSKIYNKIKNKGKKNLKVNEEKQKYLTEELNEYTRIILSDFESRISILEEENQNYRRIQ